MTKQPFRLAEGGLIDRTRGVKFSFDGATYNGFAGDTLASALIANGVDLVARSFKYHRPRGIFSAGPEEPNALVNLRGGNRSEPNTRATMAEVFDGLTVESQNRWPSLKWDVQQANQLFSRFIPAGFYYKTFMGPVANTKLWMWFEKSIRKSAGMGTASIEADPDRYERQSLHCEILIVGAGPAGLAAALTAAESGVRVVLVDEMAQMGGRLRREEVDIDGTPGAVWVREALGRLDGMENVTLLPRTTAFGYYDQNLIGCVERVTDHLPQPVGHLPRQRVWWIRAAQVVVAAGAIEQPLVFGGNDRPGVMLAGAVRAYINEYGVLPGRNAVIFANNDDAYRTAFDLVNAGASVRAVVDCRAEPGPVADHARGAGIEVLSGHAVADTHGHLRIQAVDTMAVKDGVGAGPTRRIDCDLLAISGGWQPSVHLSSQTGARPVWDRDRNCFVAGVPRQAMRMAGAAAGEFALADCLTTGVEAGANALADVGLGRPVVLPDWRCAKEVEAPQEPVWEVPDPPGPGLWGGYAKKFVDHQDDVSADDIRLAHREGYVSVEHLKRYTTLGMGTDQGKTSNLVGLAIMAQLRGEPIEQVGTTTFRPPYTPVALGALAGAEVGPHYKPLRRTPMDEWHRAKGAEWVPAGLWRRPRYYPISAEETLRDAYVRETKATRGSVGVCDVTTLGKIDLQGPDVAEFLNRIYTNGWKTLPVGKARYGLMLRGDGMVFDDGTTSRLGEHHYVMTTTTANAVPVMAYLEFLLQAVWPDLRIQATSVTEQWAAIAVAGPQSRAVLEKIVDIDLSNAAFPFMACGEVKAAGVVGRLFRISFSGELAYEINVPSDYGQRVWNAVMEAGREFNITAYGVEALGNMRVEKGHVAGAELDGRTTAADLGLGRMMSSKKDFVGKVLAHREGLTSEDRHQFVGLVPVDGKSGLMNGAQLVERDAPPVPKDGPAKTPIPMIGHVTSTGYSPELGSPIALGLVEGGMMREGDVVRMEFPLRGKTVDVRICSPHFIDPKGERLHG